MKYQNFPAGAVPDPPVHFGRIAMQNYVSARTCSPDVKVLSMLLYTKQLVHYGSKKINIALHACVSVPRPPAGKTNQHSSTPLGQILETPLRRAVNGPLDYLLSRTIYYPGPSIAWHFFRLWYLRVILYLATQFSQRTSRQRWKFTIPKILSSRLTHWEIYSALSSHIAACVLLYSASYRWMLWDSAYLAIVSGKFLSLFCTLS